MEMQRLQMLEALARKLEPTAEMRLDWSNTVGHYLNNFIEELPTGKTFLPDTDKGKALRDMPFQESPRPFEEVLHAIDVGVTDRKSVV